MQIKSYVFFDFNEFLITYPKAARGEVVLMFMYHAFKCVSDAARFSVMLLPYKLKFMNNWNIRRVLRTVSTPAWIVTANTLSLETRIQYGHQDVMMLYITYLVSITHNKFLY